MLRMVGAFAICVLTLVPHVTGWAQAVASKEQIKGLDEQVQEAKSDVLELTAELERLEEKLLFPSNTQLSIFVSIAEGDEFRLDAVDVELNGEPVTSHIYSFKELEALREGGVQKIHTANIQSGEHQLKVSLIGKSASGRDYRKTSTFAVAKGVGPKLVGVVLGGPNKGESSIAFENW